MKQYKLDETIDGVHWTATATYKGLDAHEHPVIELSDVRGVSVSDGQPVWLNDVPEAEWALSFRAAQVHWAATKAH